MKAAVFYGPNQDLKIEDIPTPKPGPGEVLVKVAATGICATDIHYVFEGVPTGKKPPLILGHEISGTIEEVGPYVDGFSPGDPVLVTPVVSCGRCYNCLIGRDNVCENMKMIGNDLDGGFAEYVKAPIRAVIKLPKDLPIPLEDASVISDAMSTAYHAIKTRGEVKPGTKVMIIGLGGLGIHALQIALALGAYVIAVDIDPRKLELAKQFGAHATINSKEVDPVAEVRKLTDKRGVDIAFDFVGNPQISEQAFRAVKTGGTVVVVGYSDKIWNLAMSRLMYREITVKGSLGSPLHEYYELIELVRIGKVKPVISARVKLEEINDALRALKEGKVIGRQIVIPK
ncbi:MAG: zinc-binding dehydrogenase [Vulcanisaeta sp.]|jgi:6-hydroxycyclohex-1-ene-1-carbonyl-CoA dehydrogenase|nr:zinc-binding dehydrogenase [Vulcanisaeta sp.]